MIKIIFVCHGNICRSPMAEFVFKDILKRKGVEDKFFVSSAATSREEIGSRVYPPAKAELFKHSISCEGKRAVQFTKSDYAKYDFIVCMDSMNVRNLLKICGADTEKKVCKLLDFTSHGGDVADPWYTGRFDTAYSDIFEGCTALYEHILSENMI